MKKIYLPLLFSVLLAGSFSAASAFKITPPLGHSIRIHVNGIKDTACFLGNYYGDKQYVQDTVKVNSKGWFAFEGKDTLPGGIYLIVMPDKKYFEMLVTEDQFFTLETDTLDFVGKMKIDGSEENKLFYEYLKFITPRGKQVDSLKKVITALSIHDSSGTRSSEIKKDESEKIVAQISSIDSQVMNYKKQVLREHPKTFLAQTFRAMSETETPPPPILSNGRPDSLFKFYYYRQHFWDSIDFRDDRLIRTPIFHNKLKQYIQSLTPQIPDSINAAADLVVGKARASKELFKYVVWYITITYERSNYMGMDAVFVHMVENYYTADQAFWADSSLIYRINDRARILKPLLLGKVAPDLVMKDTSDVYRGLHDVKARYTIMAFWDPDCPHCKKAMPVLDSLYQIVKKQKVEVYAICTEVEMDKWKSYIKEHKLEWINVADPTFKTNARSIYDVTSTPIFYLLNEKKEILAKKLDVHPLADMVSRLLKEDAAKTDQH